MRDLGWDTDIRFALKGDREAFARLIRLLSGDLYRMARTMLHSDEDCADAIQETILLAYRGIVKLREPDYFKTWLIRILINECRRISRRLRVYEQLHESVAAPSSLTTERDLDLRDAVLTIKEPIRTVIQLHYFADMPLKEIAEYLNVTEGTLKSRLHRGRKLLAAKLGQLEEGEMGYEHG